MQALPTLSHSPNGSRYRKMLCTIRQNDVFSFLSPNFTILNLVVHITPNDCVKQTHPPVDIENLITNQRFLGDGAAIIH